MAATAQVHEDEFGVVPQLSCGHTLETCHINHCFIAQPVSTKLQVNRVLPWTGIASIVNEHQGVSSQQLLEQGGLDWGVTVRPFLRKMDDGSTPDSARAREVVKDNGSEDFLGIVRTKYTGLANREIFAFGDEVVKSGEGVWVAAGQQSGGSRVLMVMKLVKEFTVLGTDVYQLYIVFRSAHDGSCSIRADIIPFRVWCLNQNHLQLDDSPSTWKIIHTTNLLQRKAEAQQSMKLALTYQKAFAQMCKELAHIPVAADKGEKIIHKVVRKGRARRDEVISDLIINWRTSPTIPEELRFTGYGIFNAVTEYYGHLARRTNPNSQYESVMNGEAAQVRQSLMKQLIG